MHLDDLLRELVDRHGSDLHLRVGEPPIMRIHGHLTRTEHEVLTHDSVDELVGGLMNEVQLQRFEADWELDLAYALEGVARYRVNLFRQQGHASGVFRAIPSKVRTVDELNLPTVLKKISMLPRGLALVTGPTGTGKSTSLAAMMDYVNTYKPGHIITIEEPIEFWHDEKLSTVTQREVPHDTPNFASALKHAMRQNPDVILVGEMRDLETISLAISAAEMGSMVFSTLHTIDAPQTIDRIVDAFDPERQAQVRLQLSSSLQAVVSQTLLPLKDKSGRIAAFEIMVCTPAIRSLIRNGRTDQIYSSIQAGSEIGSQTLDGDLLRLVKEDKVELEEAVLKCSNPNEFRLRAEMMMRDQPEPPKAQKKDIDWYG